jgi:hypothetical protein
MAPPIAANTTAQGNIPATVFTIPPRPFRGGNHP